MRVYNRIPMFLCRSISKLASKAIMLPFKKQKKTKKINSLTLNGMVVSMLDKSTKFHIMLDFEFSYGLGETLLLPKKQNKRGHYWLVGNLRVES